MALTLTASPSIPAIVPADYVPSLSVSALDTVPDVEFDSQVTVTVTTILGDTTTLNEGTDYSYNSVSDEVFFYYPVVNTDTIQFSITPDYSITDLSTQFSDLGVAPAEGSNLRDKQLLQMARDLDARILALGGQGAGGGTSAGVSSLVVGSSSYDGTIQFFAGTGLSFLEGSNSFQIELDADIRNAPANLTTLESTVSTLDTTVGGLAGDVSNIRQVPDASAATIGHVLTVNNSNEAEWQTPSGGGGGGGSTTLSGLDDVTLTTLTDGDILVASGGDFVNQAPSFLTSGDVGTVAVDNDYNSLDNLPTIPATTGTWELTTDRANVTFSSLVSETLASGYVWRWTGSQFKPAQLDIQDVNTAGNQPLVDLMAGTTEAAPSYAAGDAAKVLTVSAGGSGLEWATAAAGSGPRIWSSYFDRSTTTPGEANFDHAGTWQGDYLADEKDSIIDQFASDQITVGTSIGSYSSGEFSVSETGTYKVSWSISVGSENTAGAEGKSMDIALLRNTGGAPSADDEVLRRSLLQFVQDDIAGSDPEDDAYNQFSHASLVNLSAGDNIFLWLSSHSPQHAPIVGSWMIEKVG